MAEIEVIPYRAFKAGPYRTTMGIRSMPWDEWIELDKQFIQYHKIKAHRIRTRGRDAVRVLGSTPGLVASGRQAAVEYLHTLADYLAQRYPDSFAITRKVSHNQELGPIATIAICIIPDAVYTLPPPLVLDDNLQLSEVTQEIAERALEIASLLVQEDVAIMMEGTDGVYYLQAGAICLPGFWRIKDKIGLPLHEIHTSGRVPHFREKLQTSMERFFRRFPVDKPVIRNNYFVQIVQPQESERRKVTRTRLATLHADGELGEEADLLDDDFVDPDELAWSRTVLGREDKFNHDEDAGGWLGSPPVVNPQSLRLRSERQTLLRLPLSGGIVFGIRTYVYPIEELAAETGVAERLAGAIRGWTEEVGQYKGFRNYGEVLLPYLDEGEKRSSLRTEAN